MPILKLRREKARYRAVLAAVDFVGGTAVSALMFYPFVDPHARLPIFLASLWGVCTQPAAWLLSLYFHGQYEFHPRWLGLAASLYRNGRAAVIGTVAAAALGYFLSDEPNRLRHYYVFSALSATLLFTLARMLAIRLYPQRVLRERYVLLGTPSPGTEMARALSNGELPPYAEVVGCLTESGESDGPVAGGIKVLGPLSKAAELLAEYEVSNLQPDRLPASPCAPEKALHARQQFCKSERLYEVVVSTAPEPQDAVVDASPGAENEDRHIDVSLPQALQDVEAAHPRQHDVQNDHGMPARSRLFKPFDTVLRNVDLETCFNESLLQEVRYLPIILHDEDASRSIVHGPGPSARSESTLKTLKSL